MLMSAIKSRPRKWDILLWSEGFVRDLVRCTIHVVLVAASQLTNAAGFDPGAAESLAKHSGCNKCHAVEKKKDGPALRDRAAKYRGDDHAEGKLIKHITSGELVK